MKVASLEGDLRKEKQLTESLSRQGQYETASKNPISGNSSPAYKTPTKIENPRPISSKFEPLTSKSPKATAHYKLEFNHMKAGKSILVSPTELSHSQTDSLSCCVLGKFELPEHEITRFTVHHTYIDKQHFQVGVAKEDIDLENTLLQHNAWALCFSGALLQDGKRFDSYSDILANDVTVEVTIDWEQGQLWFAVNGDDLGIAMQSSLLMKGKLFPIVSIGYPGEKCKTVTN